MAASDLAEAVEEEISCPICFEDFEEPKCLPDCAHNVCQHCLEGMAKEKKKTIKCPVCRVESKIPKGGVASFPTNHLLVRLIERTPGQKEKKSLKQALENCKRKIEGAKTELKEMEDRFASRTEKVKQEIKSVAEFVVLMVREQEQRILDEIDLKFSQNINERTFVTQKLNTLKLCGDASSCMETVQAVLQNGEMRDLKDLSEALVKKLNDFSKSLDTRMFWAKSEFKQSFDISLTDTDFVENFIKNECSLGKLNTVQATSSVPQKLIEYSMSGCLIQTVDGSFGGIAKFTPISVAVSRITGHFVALDLYEEVRYVHIFSHDGEPLNKFCIANGDLWDLAVSSDNEIIVLDRGSNRLLHYNINGNIKVEKSLATAPKRNVKFSSLSMDIHERFIITSYPYFDETKANTLPCILVYSPLGVLELCFGERVLSSPKKAVSLNDKFFVADSGQKSVVVFNKSGIFLKEIGKSQLEIPSSIAADYNSGKLLVSDSGSSTIQIYSQAGDLLLRFSTEHPPIGVAPTKNYEHLLICF